MSALIFRSIVRRPAERFLTNGDFATSGVPIVCVTAQEYYDDESDDELLNILPVIFLSL